MNFPEAVEYLLSLGNEVLTMKLGLQNSELLLSALGKPHRSFRSVQIAGTNGKGSTAIMLDSICRAAGIKTGLYTSPHLTSITERIAIAGTPIAEDRFSAYITGVRETAEYLLAQGRIETLPTFFEQITAATLLAFAEAEVELAILETGLGGRLDSTTAAGAEIVAITSIAMDHEQYLGNTIEEIAAEKAAIIRPGVRAVIAKQDPRALEVILARCRETNVQPVQTTNMVHQVEASSDGRFCATFQTEERVYERAWLGLRGEHQIDNAATAIRLSEILSESGYPITKGAIIDGLGNANNPGRLELIPNAPSFLLDGAHNPAGAAALRNYLSAFAPRPLTIIFGAMRDKHFQQMAETIFPLADLLILTEVQNPRTASAADLAQLASTVGDVRSIVTTSSGEALQAATTMTESSGLVCITGSLYLLGELRHRLYNLNTRAA